MPYKKPFQRKMRTLNFAKGTPISLPAWRVTLPASAIKDPTVLRKQTSPFGTDITDKKTQEQCYMEWKLHDEVSIK